MKKMKRLSWLLLLLLSTGLFTLGATAQDGDVQGRISTMPIGDAWIEVANGRFMILSYDPNNPDETSDIVLYDAITEEINHIWVGETGSDEIRVKTVSRNGRYIAFSSGETYYVYDRETEYTTVIPESEELHDIALSNDGDTVFSAGHGDNERLYIFNIHADQTVSTIFDNNVNDVVISADGSVIAFVGDNGDARSNGSLFQYDQNNGITQIVPDGSGISISANGRHIVFQSEDSSLVPNDTNATNDVFVFDRQTGATSRVSVSSTGQQANNRSGNDELFISDDGQFITFVSNASNLVQNDKNDMWDTFLHDRETGQTALVSRTPNNYSINKSSYPVSLSSDGQYVYFRTGASNITELWQDGRMQQVVYDRLSPPRNGIWISGHVVDTNGFDLSSTLISVDGVSATETDQNGNYLLIGLESGTYTITAVREQYIPVTSSLTIDLADDSITDQNMILQFDDMYNGQLSIIDRNGQFGNDRWSRSSCMNNEYVAYTGILGVEQFELFEYNTIEGKSSSIETPQYAGFETIPFCLDISSDGQFILLWVLVEAYNGADERASLFLHDKQSGQTNEILIDETFNTLSASMSNDGHYVTFIGHSELNNVTVAYMYNTLTNTLHEKAVGNYHLLYPIDISVDAQHLIGVGDSDVDRVLFLHDLFDQQTHQIMSWDRTGDTTYDIERLKISDAGHYVLYAYAMNERTYENDLYVNLSSYHLAFYDVETDQRQDVLPPEGYMVSGNSRELSSSSMSNNGRYIVFVADENQYGNSALFLFDTQTNQIEFVIGVPDHDEIGNPHVSDDGSVIMFMSNAANLVSGDSNGYVFDGYYGWDIFVYERFTQQESGNSSEGNMDTVATVAPSPPADNSEVPVASPTLAMPSEISEETVVESSNTNIFLFGGLGLLFIGLIVGAVLFTRRSRKGKRPSTPPPAAPPTSARQPQFCTKCGASLLSDAQFCVSCGTTVPAPQPVVGKQTPLSQGVAQVKQNQLAAGTATLQQVVNTSPNNAAAWLWLGIAFAKQGNKSAATQCLQKAQSLGHPQAAKALARLS